jgi:hypothetical protein
MTNRSEHLTAINGGYSDQLDQYLRALIDSNWDDADRIAEQLMKSYQAPRPRLRLVTSPGATL